MPILSRILREPLLHFLVLGACLFALFQWGRTDRASGPQEDNQILVGRTRIQSLRDNFRRVWLRPPTPTELDGLIQEYVREEVLYREALKLGLNRDDLVVRRRMRQKMEFLFADLVQLEPTDRDLQTFFHQHQNRFQREPTISFFQVFLDPQRRGPSWQNDARKLLAQLDQVGDALPLDHAGDDLQLLDHRHESVSRSDVVRLFGDQFAARVFELPVGQWQGPIPSGYGVHLVRVHQHRQGRIPDFEQVRDEVVREWSQARRTEENAKVYQSLLQQYSVVIEDESPAASTEARSTRAWALANAQHAQ